MQSIWCQIAGRGSDEEHWAAGGLKDGAPDSRPPRFRPKLTDTIKGLVRVTATNYPHLRVPRVSYYLQYSPNSYFIDREKKYLGSVRALQHILAHLKICYEMVRRLWIVYAFWNRFKATYLLICGSPRGTYSYSYSTTLLKSQHGSILLAN